MSSPFKAFLTLFLVVIAPFSSKIQTNPQPPVVRTAMFWPGSRFEGQLFQNTASPTPADACSQCGYSATQSAIRATLAAQNSTRQPTPTRHAGTNTPPITHAVMFWIEGCPHCHYVLDEVLPPLQEKYGDQLQIQLIELATAEDVDRLYQTAASFGIPKEQVGVPFLVIGDRVLIGSDQIPAELPGLIEEYLAAGGVDYPNLPALTDVLPTQAPSSGTRCAPNMPCPEEERSTATSTPVPIAMCAAIDPPAGYSASRPLSNGFTLAIVIMVGMLAALGYSGFAFVRGAEDQPVRPERSWRIYAFPLLVVIGLIVAGYLAYVETQSVRAVCGPVGDCNAVQSSPYGRLFGVLPIGVLGLIGYLAILAGWFYPRLRADRLAQVAPLVVFGMTFFGVLFSLYLTYLEPFVIRAVCAWCLTSAVIMTLLLLLSLRPALQALRVSQEEV